MLRIEFIELSNIGPFYGQHRVVIHKNSTALTGANDVGKTWILRAFEIFSNATQIAENDVNLTYLGSVSAAWNTERSVYVKIGFKVEGVSGVKINAHGTTVNFPQDSVFDITFIPTPGVHEFFFDYASTTYRIKPQQIPVRTVWVSDEKIAPEVAVLGKTNQLTQRLLDHVFAGRFQDVLESIKQPHAREKRLRIANKRLAVIARDLAPSLGHELRIVEVHSQGRSTLRLDVLENGDSTPLSYRSEGFQRYLAIRLQTYFGLKQGKPVTMICLDEPERSLHPDAQHFVRAALDATSSPDGLQVIYATHSPSMINRMRPDSVRLVKRHVAHNGDLDERFAHSVVVALTPGDNFQGIRTALGLTAADSLLYGPITVVTEGDTELRCLMTILERLADSPEHEAALNLIVLLDGQGTPSFLNWCHRVQSFGCTPIAFADGDKQREIERFYTANNFTFAKIILEEEEFEDLLDREFYFACLSKVAGVECKYGEYSAWADTDTTTLRRPFSKRVGAWLETSYPEVRFSKQDVMVKAAEDDFELQFWNLDPFKSLLDTILNVASRLCLLPVVPSAEAEEELRANE